MESGISITTLTKNNGNLSIKWSVAKEDINSSGPLDLNTYKTSIELIYTKNESPNDKKSFMLNFEHKQLFEYNEKLSHIQIISYSSRYLNKFLNDEFDVQEMMEFLPEEEY